MDAGALHADEAADVYGSPRGVLDRTVRAHAIVGALEDLSELFLGRVGRHLDSSERERRRERERVPRGRLRRILKNSRQTNEDDPEYDSVVSARRINGATKFDVEL